MSDPNRLIVLGSSSGLQQADRAGSGYALIVNGRISLLDCGPGVTSSFVRRGLEVHDLDRIFVSHSHSDHIADLTMMIQQAYLHKKQTPLDLYLPVEFVRVFRSYLAAVYLFESKFSFDLNVIGYEEGFTFNGEFTLGMIPNAHLLKNADVVSELGLPNRMQCHSFEIRVGDSRLFYSSDIGSFDDIRPYLDGCAVVLIECTHVDVNEVLAFAQTAKVGRWVITHLGGRDEVAHINGLAAKMGVDNVITAVDGLELEW